MCDTKQCTGDMPDSLLNQLKQINRTKRKKKKCKGLSPEKSIDHKTDSRVKRQSLLNGRKLHFKSLPSNDGCVQMRKKPVSLQKIGNRAKSHKKPNEITLDQTDTIVAGKENTNAAPVPETKKIPVKEIPTISAYPGRGGQLSSNWKGLLQVLSTRKKGETNPLVTKKHRVLPNTAKSVAETKQTEVWFDDVDEDLLDSPTESNVDAELPSVKNLVKSRAYKGLTKAVAVDCEMVGVGKDGTDSIVARVSIVNKFGSCLYDKFVKPTEPVTDYRTAVSGIRPCHIASGEEFSVVQNEVSDILKNRILVGHAINHDLKVLFLSHPRHMIRDTSRYKEFRQISAGKTPSLKKLSLKFLGVKVQEGEHNSVQDAQATMRLYTMFRKKWENELHQRRRKC